MCGVFGAFLPCKADERDNSDAAKMAYFGLYALQHRGQESAGIASSNGKNILIYKELGLVSQAFNENALNTLKGYITVGHTRYSTTGGVTWQNAQPTLGDTAYGTIALVHNGNLVNFKELSQLAIDRYGKPIIGEIAKGNTTDTALITQLLQGNMLLKSDSNSLLNTAKDILPRLRGAFSLVFMDETKLYAARDPQGVRPLMIGKVGKNGYVVASENSALEISGATFVREVEAGELICIDEDGIQSYTFSESKPSGCVFEYVYLARPDAIIKNRNVHAARQDMGKMLAREFPVEADLVIGVPESGVPAAIGYANESGIAFAQGLTKNSYVGRTFIQPSDALRKLGIRLKLNPLKDVIEGKRLVVVDDSIVRGNTQKALVQLLRDAGAKEVHVRISSPPVKWPCFYGIDFATKNELIANSLNENEIAKEINADSLGYVSINALVSATKQLSDNLCMACFDGKYPIEVSKDQSKSVLESSHC